MTVSTATRFHPRPLAGPGITTAAAAGAAGLLALIAVSVASLSVAFPIALSLVDRGRITLSPADLATGRNLADLAWAFAAIGLVHLVAAMGALGHNRWLQRLGIAITGIGAGTSGALAFRLVWADGPGAAEGVPLLTTAAAVYLFAMTAIMARRWSAA